MIIPALQEERVTNILLYDPDCWFCRICKGIVKLLDRKHRITYYPVLSIHAAREQASFFDAPPESIVEKEWTPNNYVDHDGSKYVWWKERDFEVFYTHEYYYITTVDGEPACATGLTAIKHIFATLLWGK